MVESAIRLLPLHAKQAAEALGRAFHDDPMSRYLVPDDAKRARLLPIFFSIQVHYCLRYGEVYTSPGLDGVACWLSPGDTGPTFGRLARIGMRIPGVRRVPFGFGLAGLQRYIDAERYTGDIHRRAAPGPHCYLWIIGVEPACQGKGIGGLLMQPVLARASAQGLPCYLETNNADNLPFYREARLSRGQRRRYAWARPARVGYAAQVTRKEEPMPIIRIEMLEGRPPTVKTELMKRITDAVVETLKVEPEQVRVLLFELSPQHWAVGGKTKAETDNS